MFTQYERKTVSLRDLSTLAKLSGQEVHHGMQDIQPYLDEFNSGNFQRLEEFKVVVLELFDKLEKLKKFSLRLENEEIKGFLAVVAASVQQNLIQKLGEEEGERIWREVWKHVNKVNKALRYEELDENRARRKRYTRRSFIRRLMKRSLGKREEEAGMDLQELRKRKTELVRDIEEARAFTPDTPVEAIKGLAEHVVEYAELLEKEVDLAEGVERDVDVQEVSLIRELRKLNRNHPELNEVYDELNRKYKEMLKKDRDDVSTLRARRSISRGDFLKAAGVAGAGLATGALQPEELAGGGKAANT